MPGIKISVAHVEQSNALLSVAAARATELEGGLAKLRQMYDALPLPELGTSPDLASMATEAEEIRRRIEKILSVSVNSLEKYIETDRRLQFKGNDL